MHTRLVKFSVWAEVNVSSGKGEDYDLDPNAEEVHQCNHKLSKAIEQLEGDLVLLQDRLGELEESKVIIRAYERLLQRYAEAEGLNHVTISYSEHKQIKQIF